MNVETEKESICVNKIVGQKKELALIEGDIIVPDVKPDIINTINTSGNVCIYKKEILDGKVRIDGSINTYIMYLSDSEDSSVRGLNTSLDFTQIIDFNECNQNMDLDTNIELKSIECRVLNGRKISVKASVEFNLKVYSNENVDLVKQIKEMNDIQKLNRVLNINSLVGRGVSKAYAKDTLNIDNIDNIAEVLKVNFDIVNKDLKISYNKVLAKADARVNIMYLTEDNRINNVEGTIPVMGFIDIANVSEENICDMKYRLKNLVIKPNDIAEHSIYVEAEIELACHVYETKETNIIQDLYNPECDIKFTQKNIETMIGMQKIKDVCNIRNKVSIPEIGENKIYNIGINPIINNTNIAKDKIMYEGEINLNILFNSSNSAGIDSKLINVPFNFEIATNGVSTASKIDTNIEIKSQDFVLMDGNIDTRIDLEFNITISRNVEINVIDEIEIEDNRQLGIYSMVIYFVKSGDTLWNIAKKFKSTVSDIVAINEIEDENKIYPGQQLFIPRYSSRTKVSA